MKIRPLYDRVVIKRVEEKGDALRGGLYIPDSAKEKPQEGEVVAVGKASAWKMAHWWRWTFRWATASFSANIPGARSTWMARVHDHARGRDPRHFGKAARGCQESELTKWQNRLYMRIIPGRPFCAA